MTHFLLVESAQPSTIAGIAFTPVADTPYLVKAARTNFAEIQDVWVARPDLAKRTSSSKVRASTSLRVALTMTLSLQQFCQRWRSRHRHSLSSGRAIQKICQSQPAQRRFTKLSETTSPTMVVRAKCMCFGGAPDSAVEQRCGCERRPLPPVADTARFISAIASARSFPSRALQLRR